MDLPAKQVSDVVDHAAQLVIVMRDIADKQSGTGAFDQVYSELEDAMTTANIVSPGCEALPALSLVRSA